MSWYQNVTALPNIGYYNYLKDLPRTARSAVNLYCEHAHNFSIVGGKKKAGYKSRQWANMLGILAMCTPPVLDSPSPLLLSMYRESPVAVEEDEEPIWRTPSHKTPSRTPAKSLILPPITPKSSSIKLDWFHSIAETSLPTSPLLLEYRVTQFDDLPPELILKVFSYLRPQDLCQWVGWVKTILL